MFTRVGACAPIAVSEETVSFSFSALPLQLEIVYLRILQQK